jgi:hypothetical protein
VQNERTAPCHKSRIKMAMLDPNGAAAAIREDFAGQARKLRRPPRDRNARPRNMIPALEALGPAFDEGLVADAGVDAPAELAGSRFEQPGEGSTQCIHGGENGNGDAGSDQGVFDGR